MNTKLTSFVHRTQASVSTPKGQTEFQRPVDRQANYQRWKRLVDVTVGGTALLA